MQTARPIHIHTLVVDVILRNAMRCVLYFGNGPWAKLIGRLLLSTLASLLLTRITALAPATIALFLTVAATVATNSAHAQLQCGQSDDCFVDSLDFHSEEFDLGCTDSDGLICLVSPSEAAEACGGTCNTCVPMGTCDLPAGVLAQFSWAINPVQSTLNVYVQNVQPIAGFQVRVALLRKYMLEAENWHGKALRSKHPLHFFKKRMSML